MGDSHVGMKAGEVNIQSSTTHFLHQRWVEEFPSEDLLESVLAGIKKLQNGIVENVLDGNAKQLPIIVCMGKDSTQYRLFIHYLYVQLY